ncbi:MAG TPA: hypothetical protein VHK28_10745 [Candidatus Limnocylindria bacterium]|nr:hypothetical protein [Candidatus Limnocylindria bacterium]
MSASVRARARGPSGSRRALRRAAVLLVLSTSLLASLAIGAVSALPPAPVARLTAEEARAAGVGMSLVERADLAGGLLELRVDAAGAAPELLAVAPGGARAATAPALGLDPTTLSVVHPDGSHLNVNLDGVVGAAFAPDSETLLVVDGGGTLQRIGLAAGTLAVVADGPFLGPLAVDEDGSVLLLAVSSVEAPFRSRLVRLDPTSGEAKQLAEDDLVYGAQELTDGSLAVVAHQRGGGTVVRRVADGVITLLADLGAGAVNVAVARDGRTLAWERQGEGVFVADDPGARPRRLGPGSRPTFAPDGASLLVRDEDGGHVLVTLAGSRTRLSGPAAFGASCTGRCRS